MLVGPNEFRLFWGNRRVLICKVGNNGAQYMAARLEFYISILLTAVALAPCLKLCVYLEFSDSNGGFS